VRGRWTHGTGRPQTRAWCSPPTRVFQERFGVAAVLAWWPISLGENIAASRHTTQQLGSSTDRTSGADIAVADRAMGMLMPIEQRVMVNKPKIGEGSSRSTGSEPELVAGSKRKKKTLLLAALVLAMTAFAAYWFLLGGPGTREADATEAAETEHLDLGEVLTIEPISLNLADGRYLRLGLALQLALEVEEEPDPAVALDLAISQFSGRPLTELASAEIRGTLKAELLEKIKQAYDGEVLDLYYTDFVTQ